jgi:hypothetical protein
LLCKEPGNWEGDARNFSELTDLIKPYSASNAKNKDLENVLSSFSEDLLAQGFSSLKELDEKIARGGRSGTCGEETQIKYLKEEFKEHGMGNIAEKTVSFLKLPLSPEKSHIMQCNLLYSQEIFSERNKENYYGDLKEIVVQKIKAVSDPVNNSAPILRPNNNPLSTFFSSFLGKAVEHGVGHFTAKNKNKGKNEYVIKLASLTAPKDFLKQVTKEIGGVGNNSKIGSPDSCPKKMKDSISNKDDIVTRHNIKAEKSQISKADLGKQLSKYFMEYYNEISVQAFESRAARAVVLKLYKNLCSLERNVKKADENYFFAEIVAHVKRRELGRAGNLPKVVSRGDEFKGFDSIKRFLSYVDGPLNSEESIPSGIYGRKVDQGKLIY